MNIEKKGGRPEKEIRRIVKKQFKITEEENVIIEKLIEEGQYQSLSEMVRDIIFKKRYVVITFDNDARTQRRNLIQEVRRIGTNFNQLVKALNQKKVESLTNKEKEILVFLLSEIKTVFVNINKQFKK